MAEQGDQGSERAAARQLRVEYWGKRLDHTLTHTQTSSRLIYLIDAAVLAFVYFSIQTLGATRLVVMVASLPTLLLVALNWMHARLIEVQRSWYSGIDAKLREVLGVEAVQCPTTLRRWNSTHGIYRAMHSAIAAFLFVAAVLMLLYGLGWFPELPLPPERDGG